MNMRKFKMNSSIVIVEGVKFHSKMESNYYKYLLENKEMLGIETIRLQPPFILQGPYVNHKGVKKQAIKYIPDFEIKYKNGRIVYVDVKGMADAQALIKRKMFEYKYPDIILERVSYVVKRGGWIDYDYNESAKKEEKKKARLSKKQDGCLL